MKEMLTPFFGIPDRARGDGREGADCYGLARLAWRELRGVGLPDYSGLYHDDRDEAEIAAFVAGEKSTRWRKVDQPEFLDLILFRIGTHDSHVGLYAEPGWMLHTIENDVSKFARFDRFPWRRSLAGFYRPIICP